MKCRLHSTDLSGAVGVCASCLRERLSLIISAQCQQTHQLQLSESDHSRNSNPSSPPLVVFPRPVSPYVCRRKFDGVNLDFTDRRFYSTPQIGGDPVSESTKKKKRGKFSFITNLFKSRSDKSEADPHTASASSPLWYPSRSKPKSLPKFVGTRIPNPIQNHKVSDRGMSPVRSRWDDRDDDNEEEEEEESSSRSSESCEPTWKQTRISPSSCAATQTSRRRHSSISGLAFCLSPLVRASPNRNWTRNSLPPESGDVGMTTRKGPRLAVANSFCKNRSKKMADFGRGGGYDHRR